MQTVTLRRDELGDLAAEVLSRGSLLRFVARGSSMSPFIRDGDLLTVAPLGTTRLRLGDVVLFRSEGGVLLAHRVIGRLRSHRSLWLVRGDAFAGSVDRVPEEAVLGRVISAERNGRSRRLDASHRRWAARVWHSLWRWRLLAHALASGTKRRLRRGSGDRGDWGKGA